MFVTPISCSFETGRVLLETEYACSYRQRNREVPSTPLRDHIPEILHHKIFVYGVIFNPQN